MQIVYTKNKNNGTVLKVGRNWESTRRIFRDIRPVATMVEVKSLIEPELLVKIDAEVIVTE